MKKTSWTFHSFTRRDELLSAVDAICRTCDRLVDHDVNGERGDVCRANTRPMGSVERSSWRRLSRSSPTSEATAAVQRELARYYLHRCSQTLFATRAGSLARSQPRLTSSWDPTAVRRGVARVRGKEIRLFLWTEAVAQSREKVTVPVTVGGNGPVAPHPGPVSQSGHVVAITNKALSRRPIDAPGYGLVCATASTNRSSHWPGPTRCWIARRCGSVRRPTRADAWSTSGPRPVTGLAAAFAERSSAATAPGRGAVVAGAAVER